MNKNADELKNLLNLAKQNLEKAQELISPIALLNDYEDIQGVKEELIAISTYLKNVDDIIKWLNNLLTL